MQVVYLLMLTLLGSVFSLFGGFVLLRNNKIAQLISHLSAPFAAGALLAAVFFDLLPEALEFKEYKRIRGVDADPASYLQIRFWVSTAIKIDLRDPKDKTPYWLISTNRANELAKVLNVADH